MTSISLIRAELARLEAKIASGQGNSCLEAIVATLRELLKLLEG